MIQRKHKYDNLAPFGVADDSFNATIDKLAEIGHTDLSCCIFNNLSISDRVFKNYNFSNASFLNTQFCNVIFDNCIFVGTDFSYSSMENTIFTQSQIKNSVFTDIVVDAKSIITECSVRSSVGNSTLLYNIPNPTQFNVIVFGGNMAIGCMVKPIESWFLPHDLSTVENTYLLPEMLEEHKSVLLAGIGAMNSTI